MFLLLYGSGLRKAELLTIRIKDIDFHSHRIFVFRGKGGRDRTTLLPRSLERAVKSPIMSVKNQHQKDLEEGFGMTSLAAGLGRKYSYARKEFKWQYLFPSSTQSAHPVDGYTCRHHLHWTS
tara:strand:- start:277 stop:642 length:366 start_codon:yes stop_codon:yes gene_type:complete